MYFRWVLEGHWNCLIGWCIHYQDVTVFGPINLTSNQQSAKCGMEGCVESADQISLIELSFSID